MKERATKERAKGNKAMVVDVPTSKYSRGGGGMGYAVYFIESEANKAARKAKDLAIKIRLLELDAKGKIKEALDALAKMSETDDTVASKEHLQMALERLG